MTRAASFCPHLSDGFRFLVAPGTIVPFFRINSMVRRSTVSVKTPQNLQRKASRRVQRRGFSYYGYQFFASSLWVVRLKKHVPYEKTILLTLLLLLLMALNGPAFADLCLPPAIAPAEAAEAAEAAAAAGTAAAAAAVESRAASTTTRRHRPCTIGASGTTSLSGVDAAADRVVGAAQGGVRVTDRRQRRAATALCD